ncbi:unnamed protein product [Miscanthus lutarioriparius]|uniref:Uncharacterized protein n=1 Tax=Miscanthus lutarioriparius TaxID=422564 RepID=A0A811NWA1_9POAL|nr:unnamed protein product [Miscanthus lutarioriparius]
MPGHPTPAATRLGGVTSRRHAELLLHSGVDGVSVKDLRLRRVVPPAAGSLDTSPECVAPVKPGSVESTPPEAVSAAAAAAEAAAAGDLDRKLVRPRSKLVRDPRSFGYRRLLPFLNEMTKNDSSIGKEVLPQDTAAHSKDGLGASDSRLADESVGVSHREPEAMDSVEPVVVNTGGDTDVMDACNNVREEIKTVPHDLTNMPLLARCTRSRFVHHPSSFSYKRMLPFLMENEISAQESDRVKIRKIAEERRLASNENDASASGQQCLVVSDESSQECNRAQAEIMEEKKPPKADVSHVLDDRQLQPPVIETSPPDCSAVEVQNVMQQEGLASSQGPLTCFEGELTSDGDNSQAIGQLVVSEESPEECRRDEVKRSIHDEAVKSDGGYALDSREFQLAASEISSENSMAEVQGAAQEEPLPLDGVEENSDKGDYVSKEQAQLCVTNESFAAHLQDNAEFAEVPQCQNLDSGCHDVGFGSPTKRVIPLLHRHCAQQPQDSVVSLDDQLLDNDIQMVCRPSDPCAVGRSLSMEEMSGCIPFTQSPSSKAGISRPSGAHSMGKRALSPKKLSPKKGILKRSTRGCKGICMCLDCCTFRLHADRAFEFSRKQMKEADDIISNLLKEVVSLRSLLEKPAGQKCKDAFHARIFSQN